jgi:very-short-patch-repair endonuclease
VSNFLRVPFGPQKNSGLEARFEQGIRALHFPPWVRNHVFLPDRKFQLDFAWPDRKLAIEIDGHVHRIHERFESDLEKHWLALQAGWTVLRIGGRQIRDGRAFEWAEQFLGVHNKISFGIPKEKP